MKHIFRILSPIVFFYFSASYVQATPVPPPDWGLKGLREVSLYFFERNNYELKSSSLDSSELCGDLSGLFTKAGLRVRKEGELESPNAGEVFYSIDTESLNHGKTVIFFVRLSLSQDVRLTRDPARKLSTPSTYSNERHGFVSNAYAQQKSCEELKSMILIFLDIWKDSNREDE